MAKIVRDIKFTLGDTRHVSERASCTGCGVVAWASGGIAPREGAYGSSMAAFVVLLRDNNAKYHVIVSALAEMAGRPVMSKATAIAIYARTADMHEEESVEIVEGIEASGNAGGDETQGPVTYIRLTAMVSELVWMSEYIRGALPAMPAAAPAPSCPRCCPSSLPCRRPPPAPSARTEAAGAGAESRRPCRRPAEAATGRTGSAPPVLI